MIIGLIGFKQVGKSTAAKYLEEKYGFVRHNMKDALVAELRQNFPDLLRIMAEDNYYVEGSPESLEAAINKLFEEKPPEMRALLQNYGTEVRRKDDDYYWTNQWRLKGAEYHREGKSVVVDDVRFLNEAEAVKVQQGILIRLTRPDITTGGSHASETEQLEIVADYTIECQPDGHEALYKALDDILAQQ